MTHAGLGLAVLLLVTALVLTGAIRVARAVGMDDTLDLAVSGSILAVLQIVVTVLFVGVVLRSLTLSTVLVVTAVLSGAALLFARPPRRTRLAKPTVVKRVAAACRSHPLATALVAVAGLALSWRIVLALFLPPYGYDALAYHLVDVVDWLQVHRLTTPPLNTCCAYYPQNGELLATWPAVLGGRQEYMDLVQIPSAVLGALAVAGIARAARVRPTGPWIAAAVFVVTPILLAQANTGYVDVSFTAEAMCALYLVLRYLETPGRARWFLLGSAGAATGLCVGTKAAGIVFAVGLCLPLLVRALVQRPWTARQGLATGLFGLPITVLGIPWYLRSWIVKGNPFHPMNTSFLGVTVFKGRNHLNGPPPQLGHHSSVIQTLLSWYGDLHFWTLNGYDFGQMVGGLGPVWSYFGAVLTLVFGVYAWQRQRRIVWFFLLPLAILWVFQPDRWWARYTMPLAAVGAISVAWALAASWRPWQLRVGLGIATLALAIGGAWTASREIVSGPIVVSGGTILHDIAHGKRSYGQVFDPTYAWLDRLRRGVRIAIDVRTVHLNAPYAGLRFQNRLEALPTRTNLEAFVHTHHIAYVVTRRSSDYNKQATNLPAIFKSLQAGRVLAYRVEAGAG